MPRYPISFSTLGCPKWSWRTVLDSAVKLGYAGIELRGLDGEMDLLKKPEFGARQVAQSVADLRAANLAVTNLGASTRLHERGAVLEAQLDEARRYIDLAHRLGAPWVRVFPDRFVAGESKEATIARVGANLASLGHFAKGSGVGILVESHGEFVQAPTLEAVMRAAGDAPGVGLLWDAHHTVSAGKEAPADTWARIKPWVHHTHLKDSTPGEKAVRYVLTGNGTIGVQEIVRVLAQGGYKGYYGFEWEKQWHPTIEEPEVAFPQYADVVGKWLGEAGVTPA